MHIIVSSLQDLFDINFFITSQTERIFSSGLKNVCGG